MLTRLDSYFFTVNKEHYRVMFCNEIVTQDCFVYYTFNDPSYNGYGKVNANQIGLPTFRQRRHPPTAMISGERIFLKKSDRKPKTIVL